MTDDPLFQRLREAAQEDRKPAEDGTPINEVALQATLRRAFARPASGYARLTWSSISAVAMVAAAAFWLRGQTHENTLTYVPELQAGQRAMRGQTAGDAQAIVLGSENTEVSYVLRPAKVATTKVHASAWIQNADGFLPARGELVVADTGAVQFRSDTNRLRGGTQLCVVVGEAEIAPSDVVERLRRQDPGTYCVPMIVSHP